MSDKFRIPEKKHKQPQEFRNSLLSEAKQKNYFLMSTDISGDVNKSKFRNSLLSEAKQNNYFLMSTDLSGDVNKSKLKEHVLLGKKCMSLKSL